MTRLVLACAVILASLFTVSAQADAAGFKRYKPHAVHHQNVHKHKVYKAQKRLKALRRYRQRFVFKRHRHDKPYHFARRYR
jgi:hypothetical protein